MRPAAFDGPESPPVVAGATLREWLVGVVAVLGLVLSFFSLVAGAYVPVWLVPGAGLVLSVLLPLGAATLLLVRRFSVPGLRLGSFGVDQIAAVVAVGAVIGWIDLLRLSGGTVVAAVGLVLSLGLVVLTVVAPLVPGLRADFAERAPAPAAPQALGARPLPQAHESAPDVVTPSVTTAIDMLAPRARPDANAPEAGFIPATSARPSEPMVVDAVTDRVDEHEHVDGLADDAEAQPSSVDVLEALMDQADEPAHEAAAPRHPLIVAGAVPVAGAAPSAAPRTHDAGSAHGTNTAAAPAPVADAGDHDDPVAAPAPPVHAEPDAGGAAAAPASPEHAPSTDEVPLLRSSRRRLRDARRRPDAVDADGQAAADDDVVLEPVMPIVPGGLGEEPAAFEVREVHHADVAEPAEPAPETERPLTTAPYDEEDDEDIATVDRDSLARLLGDRARAHEIAEESRRNASQRVRVHAAAERRAHLEATARAESHARSDGFAAAETSAWERGVEETPAAQLEPPAAPAHNGFWALAPDDRAVVDSSGATIFHIGPTAWALVIEDRGSAFLIRHQDGRVGLLTDLTGVIRS